MAVCERRTAEAITPPDEFVLVLSEQEAEGLLSLIGWRVSASALNKYSLASVYDALRDAGVNDDFHSDGIVGFIKDSDL